MAKFKVGVIEPRYQTVKTFFVEAARFDYYSNNSSVVFFDAYEKQIVLCTEVVFVTNQFDEEKSN